MTVESTNEEIRELTLLEQIESDPDVNQSTLAQQLGVAVGTVNWHLKRLIAKGWRVGDAAEFLQLTEEESALVDIRLALSRCLKQRREAQMTQADLAAKIGQAAHGGIAAGDQEGRDVGREAAHGDQAGLDLLQARQMGGGDDEVVVAPAGVQGVSGVLAYSHCPKILGHLRS